MRTPTVFRRLVLLLALLAISALGWRVFFGRGLLLSGRGASHLFAGSLRISADAVSTGAAKKGETAANTRPRSDEFSGVLTYHNDEARIGANLKETILTPLNVNPGEFGKLFSVILDGDVYAQPLYLPKISVPDKGIHNLVYVATENNSVYAIDADDPKGLIVWSAHLGPTLSFEDIPAGACTVIVPLVGITGTPVIDPSTNTLYVVARTFEHSKNEYKLHALDATSGAERPGSPVVISASVPGTGDGSRNGYISFDPTLQLQRPGLALVGGRVFAGFGSTCDLGDYHGWLLAFNATTLTQVAAFITTPNASKGGIWQSGAAPGADKEGNLYIVTGDGTFNATSGGSDYGDTFLKLTLGTDNRWKVPDYFTPFDQERLDDLNEDLGSSGTLLLPVQEGAHPHLLVSAGKSGTIYLVDRDKMGRSQKKSDDQIVQTIRGAQPKIDSSGAYWEGASQRWVYMNGVGGPLQQYAVSEGKLSLPPVQSEELFGYPGSTPSISSNGKTNGIVWVVGTAAPDTRTVVSAYFHRIRLSLREIVHAPRASVRKLVIRVKLLFHSPSTFWGWLKKLLPRRTPDAPNRPAILRAYDAADVSNLLYDSTEAPQNRDQADMPVKFVVPTIANGKVYFGTQGHLDVYGLLGN